MSLRGYKPKWKKAPWVGVAEDKRLRAAVRYPKRVRPESKRRRPVNATYRKRAREFVAEAKARAEICPVVVFARHLWALPWTARRNYQQMADSMKWLTGDKYGYPVSDKLNEVHHACGRAGRLLTDERWWLAVSKQGHRWIHENEDFARILGWLCPKGHWNTHPDDLQKKGVDGLAPFPHTPGVSETKRNRVESGVPALARRPESCSQPAEGQPGAGAPEPTRHL